MKLTEGRIKVLRAVNSCPGLYASGVADLFPRMSMDGVTDYGWSRQGATRWGCGYAQPLVNAGLLKKDSRVECGGARYFITAEGLQALERIDLAEAHVKDVEKAAFWPFPKVSP